MAFRRITTNPRQLGGRNERCPCVKHRRGGSSTLAAALLRSARLDSEKVKPASTRRARGGIDEFGSNLNIGRTPNRIHRRSDLLGLRDVIEVQ